MLSRITPSSSPSRALHPVLIPVGVVLIAFFLQTALNLRLRDYGLQNPEAPTAAVVQEKYNPDVFKAFTFGHWPAGLDWLWIRTVTDPDISHVSKGTHPQLYYDLELATDLDPAFYDVYVSGSSLLAVIRNDGDGARNLLLKGERYRNSNLAADFPAEFRAQVWGGEWQLPLLLAYVYLFELDDIKNAAVAFETAAALPKAPAYLQHLAKRFQKPGGEYEVGLRLLNFMIEGAKEPAARNRLESKRESLFIAQYLFQLNQSFAKFRLSEPSVFDPQTAWKHFTREDPRRGQNPFGGTMNVAPTGRIVSSTSHEKVFGLE